MEEKRACVRSNSVFGGFSRSFGGETIEREKDIFSLSNFNLLFSIFVVVQAISTVLMHTHKTSNEIFCKHLASTTKTNEAFPLFCGLIIKIAPTRKCLWQSNVNCFFFLNTWIFPWTKTMGEIFWWQKVSRFTPFLPQNCGSENVGFKSVDFNSSANLGSSSN